MSTQQENDIQNRFTYFFVIFCPTTRLKDLASQFRWATTEHNYALLELNISNLHFKDEIVYYNKCRHGNGNYINVHS